MGLQTLKSRSEFLAVRGGLRASVPSCLIEARLRATDDARATPPRFGYTVTKKLGNAVRRNRIRRRLKAGMAEVAPNLALKGYDYVVVARSAAFDRAFTDLVGDLTRAFSILHKTRYEREQGLDKPRQQVKKTR